MLPKTYKNWDFFEKKSFLFFFQIVQCGKFDVELIQKDISSQKCLSPAKLSFRAKNIRKLLNLEKLGNLLKKEYVYGKKRF